MSRIRFKFMSLQYLIFDSFLQNKKSEICVSQEKRNSRTNLIKTWAVFPDCSNFGPITGMLCAYDLVCLWWFKLLKVLRRQTRKALNWMSPICFPRFLRCYAARKPQNMPGRFTVIEVLLVYCDFNCCSRGVHFLCDCTCLPDRRS